MPSCAPLDYNVNPVNEMHVKTHEFLYDWFGIGYTSKPDLGDIASRCLLKGFKISFTKNGFHETYLNEAAENFLKEKFDNLKGSVSLVSIRSYLPQGTTSEIIWLVNIQRELRGTGVNEFYKPGLFQISANCHFKCQRDPDDGNLKIKHIGLTNFAKLRLSLID